METDQGPVSKKRKTASVLVDQPAESDKMVVDQVTDVSATFDEVCNDSVIECFLVVGRYFPWQERGSSVIPIMVDQGIWTIRCPKLLQAYHVPLV